MLRQVKPGTAMVKKVLDKRSEAPRDLRALLAGMANGLSQKGYGKKSVVLTTPEGRRPEVGPPFPPSCVGARGVGIY